MSGEIESTSPAITKIDKSSVHKICSGQVVLDLATAVKELIENSLDAGATNVDIKLKDYGKELIEVSDNGIGIEQSNFEGLALKHHTSKLREFNDLTSVDTYGFRGEALSSLSALSNLVVTTHHQNLATAFRLDFDHNGKLVTCNPTARERGTTVSVTDLFHTLPVRYKEFQRNYKKDFGKLCHVIYAYSLINSSVRFNCVNIVGQKKIPIVSTKGNLETTDVITSLFGLSQTKKVVSFQQQHVTEEIAEEYNLSSNVLQETKGLFSIKGYISSITHKSGRSSPDRQFFFVNSRPCDHQKLSRIVNEVYHSHNHSQYPFVLLEISTRKDIVDVNITPDKRQIMMQQEKVLYAVIKSSLKNMFSEMATYYDESQNNSIQSMACGASLCESPTSHVPETTGSNSLAKFRSKYAKMTSPSPETNGKTKQNEKLQQTMNNFFTSTKRPYEPSDDSDLEDKVDQPKKYLISSNEYIINIKSYDKRECFDVLSRECENDNSDSLLSPNNTFDENMQTSSDKEHSLPSKEELQIEQSDTDKKNVTVETSRHLGNRSRVKVRFSLQQLKVSVNKQNHNNDNLNDHKDLVSCFRAKITTSDNAGAEGELKKHVSKNMFTRMKVLGQFNLGFIIAKLDQDLFIVDQHATDEKYNFETLQKKHILKTQLLIQPMPLELTPFQRSILVDNLDVFKKNGFAFDHEDPNCIKLVSAPVHRNWEFGVSDVEELIFLLSDSPNSNCRPSRVRQMFASRACRTSIMVGTALSKQNMQKLLSHMGEIDHPWNCPHGRPTMRHLVNLQRLVSS